MFNLLVKGKGWARNRDTMSGGRIFEFTEPHLVEQFKPSEQLDLAALSKLPTLFLEETSGLGNQVAHIGVITRARLVGRDVALDYAYDASIPEFSNQTLQAIATELEIEDFQFARTHWSVKDVDLFRVLLRNAPGRRPQPRVFQLPAVESIDPALVSAMMPFDSAFNDVYATLQELAKAVCLRCKRADDIWENPAVIQDVVSLIDRSRYVICDCTGRNPNVFYEIGIAHTLGRDVILIAQSQADIPFDLRHLRYVEYLNNAEGRRLLYETLLPRLWEGRTK